MTSVLVRRQMHRGKTTGGRSEKVAIYKPRGEVSEKPNLPTPCSQRLQNYVEVAYFYPDIFVHPLNFIMGKKQQFVSEQLNFDLQGSVWVFTGGEMTLKRRHRHKNSLVQNYPQRT
ncbi:hypothetical protein VULLAG_LOCUS4847 [Vulpes lagopus]